VDYLDIGFTALALWGIIVLWNIDRLKKRNTLNFSKLDI